MAKQSIFNAVTATELKTYAKRLSHGILLHGSAGVGLDTAAEWLANQAEASVLRILPEHNDKVDLEKGSITINVIRRLYDLTRTKAKKRQLVIITAADTITNEVMINDNVECLSLNDSALKWAKVLKKMAGQERVINQERLLAAGLDIRAEAVKLDRTYHQLLDKGKK